MIREFSPSEIRVQTHSYFKELFPYHKSHQKAYEAFKSYTLKDWISNKKAVGVFIDKKLQMGFHASVTEDIMCIESSMVFDKEFAWSSFFSSVLKISKTYRVNKIYIPYIEVSEITKEHLTQNGYAETLCKLGRGYVKSITYKTGLVLGGGGAKGAYQIGVWQALKELGISYDYISGTSVGALNGALMYQNDLEKAKLMWQTIDTNRILDFPASVDENKKLKTILSDMQSLTLTAMKENGVNTEPLKELIISMLKDDVPYENRVVEFYVVATRLSKLEEVVILYNDCSATEKVDWLLASSSFYPAMQPCLIEEDYYIDGGYRNNIPRDVLIRAGANDLIVVDIHGPGRQKAVQMPTDTVEITIQPSWNLGPVLFFDKNRSNWNMHQGYLDTFKTYHKLYGTWYAFREERFKIEALNLSRQYINFLKQDVKFSHHVQRLTPSWLLKHHFTPELLGVSLLESIGKTLDIDATIVYSIQEFKEKIRMESSVAFDSKDSTVRYSIGEWLVEYGKQKGPLSEINRLNLLYEWIKKENELPISMIEIASKDLLKVAFILFLEEESK